MAIHAAGQVTNQGATARTPTSFAAAGAGLAIPPLAILLHECGHYVVHAAFGYSINRLTYDSVITGPPPAGVDAAFADAVSFLGGTAVSLMLLGVAVLWVKRAGASVIPFAVIMFECIRVTVGLAQQVTRFGAAGALTTGFGELRYAARAVGGPFWLDPGLAWLEFLLPFAALGFVVRQLPEPSRLRLGMTMFISLVAGVALWIGIVGPRLLPA
jgi:hypothetical protein